jgi:hypothetical protein
MILTLLEIFLYKQKRPEACIFLQQCARRSYYLPVFFQIECAILFTTHNNCDWQEILFL